MIINKNYTKLLVATFISRFGDSLDAIAFSWLVYVMTGSRALMGGVFIISILPNIIILPFSGVLADIMDKKKLTVYGDVLRGLAVVSLALFYYTDILQVWHLFGFVLLNSIFESVAEPSRGGMFQSLLESDDYVKGSGYLSSASNLGGLIGLGIVGILISTIGIGGAIMIDAITFFISGILISVISFVDKRTAQSEEHSVKTYFKLIGEGLTYLKGKKLLVSMLLLGAFINFSFVPYNVLRPVYVSEVLDMGVEGMSYLGIALLVGMTVGGVLMGKIASKINPIHAIGFGLSMMGLMYMLLGVIDFIPTTGMIVIILAIVLTFLFGFFLPIIQAPMQGVMMKTIAPDMIGRLTSIMGVISLCAMPIGGALVSFIGDSIPVSVLYGYMGFAGLIISLGFWGKNYKQSF